MAEVRTSNVVRIHYSAEHRTAKCETCRNLLIQDPKIPESEKIRRNYCEACGGYAKGELISRAVDVQPPNPPACLSLSCLYAYFRDCLFCTLLASYHRRRVTYAEGNRHKKILERYRTGEPSPKTIWQAIHANIKLKCPVCRKFDLDPLLFRR